MVRNSKTYHATRYTDHTGSLTVLMENMNTVPVTIRNKQMSSIGDDSIMRVATLEKTPSYLRDILSIKGETLQSSVSSIANDQTVKLVNNETNGFQELPVTRSLAANVM